MSGDLIVRNVPSPQGTPYVWPGLQPGSTGVLQAVLDGRYLIVDLIMIEVEKIHLGLVLGGSEMGKRLPLINTRPII